MLYLISYLANSASETNLANIFRIGLVQMACGPDSGENLRRAEEFIRQAAGRDAQVVCLPELFRTQYFCQREDIALFDLSEPIPGPTTQKIAEIARQEGVAIIASIFEKRAPGVYHNTAAVLDSDGTLHGLYRKMHIPDDPLYYEKFYFTPGDLGFKVFELNAAAGGKQTGDDHGSLLPQRETGNPSLRSGQAPSLRSGQAQKQETALRIGTLICWDQWYPEGARLTALQGAHVLFYPTAIGWHPAEKEQYGAAQLDAWRTIQRGHAIANGVYVAAVNRVGHETGNVLGKPAPGAGLDFWGGSFLCDPFGQLIAEASLDREEVLVGEVDLKKMEEVRRNWPFLRDRRIDAYGAIGQRFLDGK
jgi:N-carbamoylputrescine amidase